MRRRFVVRTTDSRHAHPVAANRLDQQFDVPLPNQAWAADITYIPTGEGWLYLAAVIDLCSRKVVGWAADDHLRAELPCRGFADGARAAPARRAAAAPQRPRRAVRLRRLSGAAGPPRASSAA